MFALGFQPADVISQESWWGGFLSGPLKRNRPQQFGEVLVVNATDATIGEKLHWIGPDTQAVIVPDFHPGHDRLTPDWVIQIDEVRRTVHSGEG